MAPSSRSIFPREARPCEHLRVLLVDDDDAFRTALGELLRDDGHDVRAYRSAAEIASLAELPPIDALLADYQLQGLDEGLRLARWFRTVYPDALVILMSAFASDLLMRASVAAVKMTLLRKPLQYEELHRLLHEHGS